ncbi:hypothetical protein Amet_2265 [Alkaliphilus metalliredigens QYMF]|uniref:Uncharacterized protein n=1 Tax=Alkaliphilus metalliredigens (strain QYMF) TaxID=293826 RepID=A6TQF5_ALKMQ|nr:hypothetical protein [Alkaliphilus metalliredigens]ABR48423.1 hypothetical protein Amet_2265 [Alkaliphilus metalliredigens QYMF]
MTETLGKIISKEKRDMVGEILLGIFGTEMCNLIKKALKDSLVDRDEDLIERIHSSIEEASKVFFEVYGSQFGKPSSSFLARQSNIEVIVKSIFYGSNFELSNELWPEGFDGAADASRQSLDFFVDKLNEIMMKDFRLNQIITEKKHISENEKNFKDIMELLGTLTQQGKTLENNKNFNNWIMKDEYGKESKIIEGKQYRKKFPNGLDYKYMFKDDLIYVEILDLHGQKSYYELDINGNVKDSKFPYELSEYKLIVAEDQIVNKNIFKLPNGFYREAYKLKWNKQADVIFNQKGEIQHINLRGGWEVKHLEKVITPKY